VQENTITSALTRKTTLNLLPFGLFSIVVILPLFLMPHDMWDGSIIEYASQIKDLSGIKVWFFESGWFLQYFFHKSMIDIAENFGISYNNINTLFVAFFMYLILRETFKFGFTQIKLTSNAAIYASVLTATFSGWSFLFSSVMTYHLACLAIGMLSVRLIHEKRLIYILLGFVLLIPSFTLSSLLVFLPIYSYVYDVAFKFNSFKLLSYRLSLKTTLIFFIGLSYFAFIGNLFPSFGLYDDYNQLVLTSLSYKNIYLMIIGLVHYFTFLIPTALVVTLIFLLSYNAGKFFKTQDSSSILFSDNLHKNLTFLILLGILFFAAIFPYVAVGKSTSLWNVTDWNGRQSLLSIVPLSLISALFLQTLYENASSKASMHAILIGGLFILFVNLSLLISSNIHKLNRHSFEFQLEDIIKSVKNELQPGILHIVGDGIPGPEMRSYESNFLIFRATGKSAWWSKVGGEVNYSLLCELDKNVNYEKTYIYNFDKNDINNLTTLEIKASNFRGPINMIKNVFGYNSKSNIEVISLNNYSKKFSSDEPCNTLSDVSKTQ
jgi:hypothetical protein